MKVVLAGAFLVGAGSLTGVGASVATASDDPGIPRLEIVEQVAYTDCPYPDGKTTTVADTR
jgi:hypothetical protein